MGRTLVAVVLLLVGAVPARAADPALVIVVHPQRSTQLGTDDVADIYLKKRRFWPDGEPIVVLNLEAGSRAREYFSRRVLGTDSMHLGPYWNQQYFQGIFPPVTLSSSTAVKRYVATDRNAIGYIEATEVDESVRVMARLD